MTRRIATHCLIASALLMAGCASDGGPPPLSTGTISSEDAARGGTQVLAGQRTRVFVFSGLGANCSPTTAPQFIIDKAPTKGVIFFAPVEPTTVQYSLSGKCIGQRVVGTGVYYTPHAGATGADTFTVSAIASQSTTATRTIAVKIAE